MSTAAAGAREDKVVGRAQWIALTLLVVSICINYMDRGNLSVAAHDLSLELRLDPAYTGFLLSAFFLELCLVPDCLRLANRSLQRQLGLCRWIFPLVARDRAQRARRDLCRIIRPQADSRHERVGSVSVLLENYCRRIS